MNGFRAQILQAYLSRGTAPQGVERLAQPLPATERVLASHVAAATGRPIPAPRTVPGPSPPGTPPSPTAHYIPLPFPPPSSSAFGIGGRLPHAVRSRAEEYFAADLGGIQLYSSPRLGPLGARAATLGSRMVFAPGYFDPASAPGRALLAHELAHVVQQRRGRVLPPPAPGFFLVRDPRLEAEAQAAAHAFAAPSRRTILQARLLPTRLRTGGVLQAAPGDWYNDGRVEVREVHGTANRGDAAIYLRGVGNEAYITYDLEADGTTVIIPHFEAINFDNGHGVGWMLMRVLADHGLGLGRTHARLGTAVYRNPANTHGPTNAAVHIYDVLGFDVSSSQAVLASRVSLNQIRQRAVQNAQRYHWAGGRLPTVQTPLIQNDQESTGCCPRCYLTTACVHHFGLAVDGEELTVLRGLRDGFMSTTPSRRRHLERYYATAPRIVRRLEASRERDLDYAWVYGVLRRCVGLIREGGHGRAMVVYGRAVETLERRFLLDGTGGLPRLPVPAALFRD